MYFSHLWKVSLFLNSSHAIFSHLKNALWSKHITVHLSQYRNYLLLLQLVTHYRNLLSTLIQKLSALQGVPDYYRQYLTQHLPWNVQEMLSLQLHRSMPHLIVTWFCKSTIYRHLIVLAQHVFTRNSHIVKSQITIILSIKSEFRSNITYNYTRKRFMAANISYRHNEVLNPMFLTID